MQYGCGRKIRPSILLTYRAWHVDAWIRLFLLPENRARIAASDGDGSHDHRPQMFGDISNSCHPGSGRSPSTARLIRDEPSGAVYWRSRVFEEEIGRPILIASHGQRDARCPMYAEKRGNPSAMAPMRVNDCQENTCQSGVGFHWL